MTQGEIVDIVDTGYRDLFKHAIIGECEQKEEDERKGKRGEEMRLKLGYVLPQHHHRDKVPDSTDRKGTVHQPTFLVLTHITNILLFFTHSQTLLLLATVVVQEELSDLLRGHTGSLLLLLGGHMGSLLLLLWRRDIFAE